MKDLTKFTIADIVSEHNETATVFEKHGIEYYNFGDLSLAQAAKEVQMKIDTLLPELSLAIESEKEDNINFNKLSISEIIDIIRVKYHEFLREKISELSTISQKLKNEHIIKNIDKVEDVLLSIFNFLAPHMLKEEKVLFPYLEYMEHMVAKGKAPKAPSFGRVKSNVSTMFKEHKDSTDKLNELRRITQNYQVPENAAANYRYFYQELHTLDNNLRMHIHLENNVLFKKARAMEEQIGAA